MQNFKIYIYFIILLCVFTIGACSDESSGDFVAGQEGNINVNFQLQLNGFSGGGSLRATGFLPGDNPAGENKIGRLTIFVIDLDENDELNWDKIKSTTIANPTMNTNTEVSVEMLVKTNVGKKQVYIGINMSNSQISSFCLNKGTYTSSKYSYDDVIHEFVDLSGMGIVMFGQAITTGGTPSAIINIQQSEDIPATVELSRVVSKVALTYTPVTPGSKNATLISGIGGFIDADSVYFMLNSTNKTIDFIPKLDPQYKMSDYIEYDPNKGYSTSYYYKKNPLTNFMLYSPLGAVPGSSSEVEHGTAVIKLPNNIGAGDDNPYHRGLQEYDPNMPPFKHYTSSLYCLENMIGSTGFTCPADTLEQVRQGINTFVIVTAKYVPNLIYHSYDGVNVTQVAVASHSDLLAITNNDDDNGAYTFYAVLKVEANPPLPAEYDYYTYNAKELLVGQGSPLDFITYKKGYGYYSTFVTQRNAPTVDDNYSLVRNHYYILNVQEFTPPGAVYPQQKYMMVNSQVTEWEIKKVITVPLD